MEQIPSTEEQLKAELQIYKHICHVLILVLAMVAITALFFLLAARYEADYWFHQSINPIKQALGTVV